MGPSEEHEKLHDLRKEIDALIKKVGAIKQPGRNEETTQEASKYVNAGREISLSYTHLQEAKMWLGQALGMLGSELPAQFADKA